MTQKDRAKIVQGYVFYQNQWMPMEKKIRIESQNRKKISDGFVFFQGEWISIEEKIARVTQKMQNHENDTSQNRKIPDQININQTFNQQTYTIDNRTTTIEKSDPNIINHEHKHIHVDAETLKEYYNTKNENQKSIHSKNDASLTNDSTKNKLGYSKSSQAKLSYDAEQNKLLPDNNSTIKRIEQKDGNTE